MGVPSKDTRFLRKLYLILKEEAADVVSWSEDGRAFAILDTARFQRVIKAKYHLSSLCTFRQNLHAHGFSEIELPAADNNNHNDEAVDSKANVKNPQPEMPSAPVVSDIPETYFHPFFVRGYPEFLEKISFDPSVKFRCQECKRQPNDLGTKCTFRKNSFRTTRAEAAIAILANAGAVVSSSGQSSPLRHAAPVAQNSVTTGPPAGRSPLMVHVGGPRQQQQRETGDAALNKPGQKQLNPPDGNPSVAFSGAFLRPSVASLSSEQSTGQRATLVEQNARNTPPVPVPESEKTKPATGSLMVRLSFGRKDEPRSDGAAHADLMAELAARVAQKPLTTTNSKGPVSSNPVVAKKSTTSKPKASRKAASTAASKPVAAMSLKRISPAPSERDASDDADRRLGVTLKPNQVKIAAFPTSVYSHSTAYSGLYSGTPQPTTTTSGRFSLAKEAAASVTPPPSTFTPWSSNPQLPRNDILQRGSNVTVSTEQALAMQNFATVKAHLSQAQARLSQEPQPQSEPGRSTSEQHASSIPADSEPVPYEHSTRWSRHNISSLASGSRHDQEQRSMDTDSPSRDDQHQKPASPPVYKKRSFDPTRDEYLEGERAEQPEPKRQAVVKAVEPAVLVIPKRQSMLSGSVVVQLSTSAATKRTTNLVVMPSIQPPMSVTLSIGGRRKPNSSDVTRSESQVEQDASRKRARVSSPVVSTIRRDDNQAQQTQGTNASGPNAGVSRSFATKHLHSGADTEMVDVSGRTFVKRPQTTAAAASSANATPPQKTTPPRARKVRAKLVAKAKGGTDEQAGLSLLVLASSEHN